VLTVLPLMVAKSPPTDFDERIASGELGVRLLLPTPPPSFRFENDAWRERGSWCSSV
jgi:hypothetical protein